MIECEYPDCEEEGEYYAHNKCPEVAACEDHVEWAFEVSAKKPKKVYREPPVNYHDDPWAIIAGLRNTISMFNYIKLNIKEIGARPDMFNLIARYLPCKEVYEYDEEKFCRNGMKTEIERIIACELDGIIIYPRREQGCKFSFGVEVKSLPMPLVPPLTMSWNP